MIEAYEIGIKLALQDGVSEGIAAIRRDLGSLDMAIAQTTLRLSQLQRIGAQALAMPQEQSERLASGPPARRAGSIVTPSPATEAEPAAASIETQAVMPALVQRPRPLDSPPVVLAPPRMPVAEASSVPPAILVSPGAAAPEVATRPPAIAVEAVRVSSSPRLPEPPAASPAVPATLSAPTSIVPATVRLPAPMPDAAEPRTQSGRRTRELALPRPEGQVSSAPASMTVLPQRIPFEPSHQDKVPLPVRSRDQVRELHVKQSVMASDLPPARMAPMPTNSAAVFSPTASAAPSASPSYAPPAAAPRTRETGMRGDVFLDGTRVGRWMSEQMARDAGRPNTGPTGFDPRRSPAWPGAAVTW